MEPAGWTSSLYWIGLFVACSRSHHSSMKRVWLLSSPATNESSMQKCKGHNHQGAKLCLLMSIIIKAKTLSVRFGLIHSALHYYWSLRYICANWFYQNVTKSHNIWWLVSIFPCPVSYTAYLTSCVAVFPFTLVSILETGGVGVHCWSEPGQYSYKCLIPLE